MLKSENIPQLVRITISLMTLTFSITFEPLRAYLLNFLRIQMKNVMKTCFKIPGKLGGNETIRFDDENVAITDKISEDKIITPLEH